MKKISLMMLLCLASGSVFGAQISQKQALGIASKYIKVAGQEKRLARVMSSSMSDVAPYYIFNATDGNGFVIVSGDDSMTELIGYSKTGSIDADNMPDALREGLDNYAAYVEQVQDGTVTPLKSVTSEGTPVVNALLTCNWNQTTPYDRYCPVDPTTQKQSAVGCVATAMAQVAYYWKWPLKPKAQTISYRCSNGTRVEVDFSQSQYDWDNMIDFYVNGNYTDEQANAVAKLSYDLGVAVHMDYSSSASGAQDSNVPYALADFGYKCQLYNRNAYTKTGFIELIESELDQARPMIFCGVGTAGGHCFVADGYDTNGYLHINWGWAGSSDGFFDVDAMDPPSLGTGGGAGGFNSQQTVISVIKDETMTGSAGQLPLTIYNDSGYNGYVQPSKTEFTKGEEINVDAVCFANWSTFHDFNGLLAIGIYDSKNNLVAVSSAKSAEIPTGQLLSSVVSWTMKSEFQGLADGSYSLWAVSKESSSTENFDWIRVGMDEQQKFKVEGNDIVFGSPIELSVASIAPDSEEIYPGSKVKFNVVLNNAQCATGKGTLQCELRNATTGARVISTKPSITLDGKDQMTVTVSMTMMKSAVTAGQAYTFNVVKFNNGTNDYEISGDPYEFTMGDSGVDEVKANGISVYPTLTEGIVNVTAADEIKAIEAYSTDGRLAARAEGSNSVNLSNAASGIYMLKVTTAAGTSVHRVVKR